ncbi:TetR/AcrR family transcriptional regulator [Bradyrhizobium sp. SSUT18]|uniref:TetR/AcrR family transcriptional regulator n=1 Tax=Bradyrhizobium sp. SSUT18 TaxID=3040602 RepID=UPI002448955A|nr:TetR/AcrR family transcriptional regulator [Bradyrhizobium sp. SSUT18]MDH2400206.1 TetR/AcrR family transcriptional regulator [Bradyrhizobium sp. SSUT18]
MQSKRQKILEAAIRLFELEGIQAVGIERNIAESGVTRMTMYNQFGSKESLIVEALQECARRSMHSLKAFVDKSRSPRGKVRAIFLWHDQWFRRANFEGCVFNNVAGEIHDGNSAVRRAVLRYKRDMERYVASVLADQGITSSKRLATRIMLLVEGATAMAYVCGKRDAAIKAWDAFEPSLKARELLEAV